jgi:hypothetical protein
MHPIEVEEEWGYGGGRVEGVEEVYDNSLAVFTISIRTELIFLRSKIVEKLDNGNKIKLFNLYGFNRQDTGFGAMSKFPLCVSREGQTFCMFCQILDRLCGLVVTVPGYRSGGPGFDSRALQRKKSWVWNGVHPAS